MPADGRRGPAGLPPDWAAVLGDEIGKAYWPALMGFVEAERAQHTVYPPAEQVFNAFVHSAYADTRVVILGQDPYHGAGQAHGLSFSVPHGVSRPPSLVNVLKELSDDIGVELPDGNLAGWAEQGVLLLNTVLTVRRAEADSHRRQGWETFTDAVITALQEKDHRVVFVLWGGPARRKAKLVTNEQHRVVESAHPSPLAAYRGFWGSRPFSQTNALLRDAALEPIIWGRAGA